MGKDFYPVIGQKATFIAVKNGQVNVVETEIVAHEVEGLTVRYEGSIALESGNLVSLNYGLDGHQWRAKAVVSSHNEGKLSVNLRGNPSRGESRDFIRAQLDIPTAFIPLQSTDLEAAKTEMERHFLTEDDDGWVSRSVNLSGNGLAFTWEESAKKGRYVAALLLLQKSSGNEVFVAAGKVVRCKPTEGGFDVALFFDGLSDEEQDRLFDYVSAWYHAKIHMALSSLTGNTPD